MNSDPVTCKAALEFVGGVFGKAKGCSRAHEGGARFEGSLPGARRGRSGRSRSWDDDSMFGKAARQCCLTVWRTDVTSGRHGVHARGMGWVCRWTAAGMAGSRGVVLVGATGRDPSHAHEECGEQKP